MISIISRRLLLIALAASGCKPHDTASDLATIVGEEAGEGRALAILPVRNVTALAPAAEFGRRFGIADAAALLDPPVMALAECRPSDGTSATRALRVASEASLENRLYVNAERKLVIKADEGFEAAAGCTLLPDVLVTYPVFESALSDLASLPPAAPEGAEATERAKKTLLFAQTLYLAMRGPHLSEGQDRNVFLTRVMELGKRHYAMAKTKPVTDVRRDLLVYDSVFNPCVTPGSDRLGLPAYAKELVRGNYRCEPDGERPEQSHFAASGSYETMRFRLLQELAVTHYSLYWRADMNAPARQVWELTSSAVPFDQVRVENKALGQYLKANDPSLSLAGAALALTDEPKVYGPVQDPLTKDVKAPAPDPTGPTADRPMDRTDGLPTDDVHPALFDYSTLYNGKHDDKDLSSQGRRAAEEERRSRDFLAQNADQASPDLRENTAPWTERSQAFATGESRYFPLDLNDSYESRQAKLAANARQATIQSEAVRRVDPSSLASYGAYYRERTGQELSADPDRARSELQRLFQGDAQSSASAWTHNDRMTAARPTDPNQPSMGVPRYGNVPAPYYSGFVEGAARAEGVAGAAAGVAGFGGSNVPGFETAGGWQGLQAMQQAGREQFVARTTDVKGRRTHDDLGRPIVWYDPTTGARHERDPNTGAIGKRLPD